MTTLERLEPNAVVCGILLDCSVMVVNVQWFGSKAAQTPAIRVRGSWPVDLDAWNQCHTEAPSGSQQCVEVNT